MEDIYIDANDYDSVISMSLAPNLSQANGLDIKFGFISTFTVVGRLRTSITLVGTLLGKMTYISLTQTGPNHSYELNTLMKSEVSDKFDLNLVRRILLNQGPSKRVALCDDAVVYLIEQARESIEQAVTVEYLTSAL